MTVLDPQPNRDDPRALLLEAAEGSDAALGTLLEAIQPRLLQRIRLMMGQGARRVADSGDFLGGLMLDLVKSVRTRGIPENVDIVRWATHVARNNIRDSVRKKHELRLAELSSEVCLLRDPIDGSRAPDERADLNEQIESMLDALETLSDDHRRVIELRDLDGLSYREIAERLGKESANAARLLHARALSRLSGLCTRRS